MSHCSSKENMARLFNRYVWLVDLIYRYNHKFTFYDINKRWLTSNLNSYKEDLPLKTFHNHKTAIKTMFDINIECNRKNGFTYYIEDIDNLEYCDIKQWLVNSFAINNLIIESKKIKHRILFENIPSGRQFLTTIIEAMRENRILEIYYQSFNRDLVSTLEIEPYCVKVFRQRWYLVGNSYKGIRIYALDRIKSIRIMNQEFIMPQNFDAKVYFSECFGISRDIDVEVNNIRIKVNKARNKHMYFKSLPLHHSQHIINETDDYIIYGYYIRPTYDLRMEILSHGNDIEVISPISFRKQIAEIISQQNKLYK